MLSVDLYLEELFYASLDYYNTSAPQVISLCSLWSLDEKEYVGHVKLTMNTSPSEENPSKKFLGLSERQCFFGDQPSKKLQKPTRVLKGSVESKNLLNAQSHLKRTKSMDRQNSSALVPPTSKSEANVETSEPDPDAMIIATQHLSTMEKSFQCSLCVYKSVYRKDVRRHIMTKHLNNTSVYQCQMCDMKANFKFNLKTHYMKKHGMPETAAKAMIDA